MSALLLRQLGPDEVPVVGARIPPRDEPTSCPFETDAVFRGWDAALIAVLPLPYLGIAFDVVAELDHATSEFRN